MVQNLATSSASFVKDFFEFIMDCYKDRTFCSFHQNCIDGEICLRALTEEVKRAAIKADLPVAQYVEAPRCFNEKRKRTHIKIIVRGNVKLIPVGNIYYFKSEDKYTIAKHKEGESCIDQNISIKTLAVELEDSFIQVRRNALVAKKYVNALSKQTLFIEPVGDKLDVSRRHLANVRKLIKERQFA